MSRRLADLFHGRPRLQVGALLSGPLAWLVILYLGSLVVLLIASLWSVDALSGELIKGFTFDNYKELWNTDVYRTVAFRTIGIASAVTVTDALLYFEADLRGTKARLVPWLQDFSLGRTYTSADLQAQVDAARSLDTRGFLLWNPLGLYTPHALSRP